MPGSSRPCSNAACSKFPHPRCWNVTGWEWAPRLSATQQERAALIANIQFSLSAEKGSKDRAWAWVHAPRKEAPFDGDSPLYFMLENGLPALREVARQLVRESEPR